MNSNFERIARILVRLSEDDGALSTTRLLEEVGVSRSTGFGLIRAMVRDGLVRRCDHGVITLGEAARDLAFVPLDPVHLRPLPEVVAAEPFRRSSISQTSRAESVWNPELADLVNTKEMFRRPPYNIVFLNASISNPWRHALARSVDYGVKRYRDLIARFETECAEDDPELQARQISGLAEGSVDGVILSAVDANNPSILRELARLSKKCAIVCVDRRVASADSFVSFVSASNSIIGRSSALWLTEQLSGTGRVWLLAGAENATPSLRRRAEALQVFTGAPDIRVEAVEFTGWTEDGGRDAVEKLLDERGSPPDGVWCDSGLQGLGSLKAFIAHGAKVPPHTGGDLNGMYRLALSRRVPFVAIDYPASMGARAVDVVIDILSGKSVARRVEVPVQTVTPRGCETASIKADQWAENHVRWDQPDDVVLSQGHSLPVRGQRHLV